MRCLTLLKADLQRLRRYSGDLKDDASTARVLCAALSPRFSPVFILRIAQALSRNRLRPLAKIMNLLNFTVFGLEVNSACEIGPGLVIPHTQGTVIGAFQIGRNATIYHQVTIGAKEMDIGNTPASRPRIGNDVTIGCGAKLLGDIFVGDGAIIGANAVVLMDIPSNALAVGVPAHIHPRSSSSDSKSQIAS